MYYAKKFLYLRARKKELTYVNLTNPNTMSIFSSYVNTLNRRYATFSGRANRREYCAFIIVFQISLIIWEVLFIFSTLHGDKAHFLLLLLGVVVFVVHIIPCLALVVRRLHDLDTSGWWLLLGYLFNIIFFIFLGFMKGSPKKNDYGNPPARKDNVAITHLDIGRPFMRTSYYRFEHKY